MPLKHVSQLEVERLDGQKSQDVVQETDIESSGDSDHLDNNKLENGESSRTLRMLKREEQRTASYIKSEDELELKKLSLLDDGITNQHKLDLLKALTASRESAAAELSIRQSYETEMCLSMSARGDVESAHLPDITDKEQPILTNENVLISTDPPEELNESPLFGSPMLVNCSQSETSDELFENDEISTQCAADVPKVAAANKVVVENQFKLVDTRKFNQNIGPFCRPDGANPDEYSRIIVNELTRYHENLHAIQRRSLNILEWEPPIVASGIGLGQQRTGPTRPPANSGWLSTTHQSNHTLSEFDFEDDKVVEIKSCSSSDSSHEEFVMEEKKKPRAKRTKKPLAPKKVPSKIASKNKKSDSNEKNELNACQNAINEEGGIEEQEQKHVKKNLLTLKRKVKPFDEMTTKKTKSTEASILGDWTSDEENPLPTRRTSNAVGKGETARQDVTNVVADDRPSSSLERKVTCPLCNKLFNMKVVEEHASACNGGSDTEVSESIVSPVSSKIIHFTETKRCYHCGGHFQLRDFDFHVLTCNERN